jgi:hypothetical protein
MSWQGKAIGHAGHDKARQDEKRSKAWNAETRGKEKKRREISRQVKAGVKQGKAAGEARQAETVGSAR